MDIVTLFGLFLALIGILGGQVLEGGHINSLMQLTAGLIVLGGTFGAVLVSTTRKDLNTGFSLLKLGFTDKVDEDPEKIIRDIVGAAQLARRESMLALERTLPSYSNPFMKNVFRFMIDGVDAAALRDIFENEISNEEHNLMAGAKVWADAGGYAPTIGIIGAVLGLIHVMENLSDTSKLGAGIAVAFVATIYGVGSANILFLPLSSKIKRKVRVQLETKQMILEGAIGIMSGLNPYIIEQKLRTYLHEDKRQPKKRAE